MNKFNYAEQDRLGYSSRSDYQDKLLDEQITQHDSVLKAIKDLETEKKNIERNHNDSFHALVEVFQWKITNMDTRGINQCEVYELEKLRSYNKIIFKVTSTASDWWATIEVSQESRKNTYKDVSIQLKYNPDCADTMLDVKAFQEQIQDIDFQVFMDDINNNIKDYMDRTSILSTQANALLKKIQSDHGKERETMMAHLISKLTTDGLHTPRGSYSYKAERFIVTERQNSDDGYFIPWHIKVLDDWKYTGEVPWNDDSKLECEVTFRKRLYDKDYNAVGYKTQTGKVMIDKYQLEQWVWKLHIYQIERSYNADTYYGSDYYNRALKILKRAPYLNTSEPSMEGYYSLYQNKKDRALRDSFGEWVEVRETEQVEA